MSFKIFIILLIIFETAKGATYSKNFIPPNNRLNNLKNDAHFIKILNKAIFNPDTNIYDLFENVNFGSKSLRSSDSLFPNVSLPCLEQLQTLLTGIQNRTTWALSGKFNNLNNYLRSNFKF